MLCSASAGLMGGGLETALGKDSNRRGPPRGPQAPSGVTRYECEDFAHVVFPPLKAAQKHYKGFEGALALRDDIASQHNFERQTYKVYCVIQKLAPLRQPLCFLY